MSGERRKDKRRREVRQGKRGGDSDGARKRSEEMEEIKQRNRKRIFFEVISRMHTLDRQSLLNVNLLVSESLTEKTLQSLINKPTAD